ncbi:ArsR family transcriptional regulator [Isoptericola sp. CG 20/1183]|uniref:ArsR family transcriptional regulator n=1 Tax=Isoptericola halotolerans TaxID=300560 RepID=A0ABX5ELH0_9MICO|nr:MULTISPECIES: metalloregulator ArsR/SmtB family transcription factor [Isoptericola]PRZ04181.1 ArsR family transcriptional regulator [Isoptericola sp. CG 20/1183]PRZ09994.1 ArsR family transcriptional regulator [Isoptericola halotolerans]
METVTLTHTAALARLGHALGDPTRTRIMLALRDGPAYPADLADGLGVSRQVMSNQLACLRGCGLVTTRRDGRRTEYRLCDPALAHALGDLLRLTLAVDPDCCGPDCTCASGAPSHEERETAA